MERAAEGKLVLGGKLAKGYSATREQPPLHFYARAASVIEYTSTVVYSQPPPLRSCGTGRLGFAR